MTDRTPLPVACTLSEPELAKRLTGPPGTRDFLACGIGDPGIV